MVPGAGPRLFPLPRGGEQQRHAGVDHDDGHQPHDDAEIELLTTMSARADPNDPADGHADGRSAGYTALLRTNFMLATGIRNAQAPIMIGNAASGFMPSSATRIMHGA